MSKRKSAVVLAVSAVAGIVPLMATSPAMAAGSVPVCLSTPQLTESDGVVTGYLTNGCDTQSVKITAKFTALKGSSCPSFTKSGQVTLGTGTASQSVTVPSGCTGTAVFTAQDGKQVVTSNRLNVS